jgi:peptidoglycan/LPS O-acetylase OafA/YrhL
VASTLLGFAGFPLALWANVAGVCLLVAALAAPGMSPGAAGTRVAQTLGGLSLGVYLTHVLFVEVCRLTANRQLGPAAGESLAYGVTVTVVALLGSSLLTVALLRTRAGRWLVC